jgi:hypothetical protein
MIPQERGIEGIMLIPILTTLLSKGVELLRDILRGGQEDVDSP